MADPKIIDRKATLIQNTSYGGKTDGELKHVVGDYLEFSPVFLLGYRTTCVVICKPYQIPGVRSRKLEVKANLPGPLTNAIQCRKGEPAELLVSRQPLFLVLLA